MARNGRIAAIAVEKEHDAGVLAQRGEAGLNGAPIATPRFDDNPCACWRCTLGCSIS
jgi:hypothetical protein